MMHNCTKKVLEAFKVLPNLVIGFYHNVIDAEVNSVAEYAPYFAYCLYSFLSLYSPWLGGKLLRFGC